MRLGKIANVSYKEMRKNKQLTDYIELREKEHLEDSNKKNGANKRKRDS